MDIQLFAVKLDRPLTDEETDALLRIMPDERRARLMRMPKSELRQEPLCAYGILYMALRAMYGWKILPRMHYSKYGKPGFEDFPEVQFNISHTRGAVLVGLHDEPLGVDIERIRPVKEGLVRYIMNAAEAEAVFAAPCPELMFTRLWTQKEAVVKCTGEGISNDLKNVLSNFLADKKLPSPSGEGQGERLLTVESPDGRYVYSICFSEE